jgi:RNA polymerase sigma-70 factor, ECF subfamily
MSAASPRDPERQTSGRELGRLIESAVDNLGDGYREVFMLRQIEGLSAAETAQVLGVGEDVVNACFSRARHAIEEDLLERAGAAAATAFTFGQARCDRIVATVLARLG